MNIKNKIITLKKNEDRFYSFTDKYNAYLMMHVSSKEKTDGFIKEDKVLFNDFDLQMGKTKYSRLDADATSLLPFGFILEFAKLKLRIAFYLPEKAGTIIFRTQSEGNADISLLMKKDDEVTETFVIKNGTDFFAFNDTDYKSFSKDTIKDIIKETELKAEENIRHFDFCTGDDYTDKALFWAQLTGTMLIAGGEKDRGIWAGLPWFRQNWGRDTFIALRGILLVNGFFEEAKNVLQCFARYQNLDVSSPSYGRIPNRYINDKNIIYNTADANLWFIKTLWEYLQYTGDKEFLQSIWNTVKTAVDADLQHRTDSSGFLINYDSDTWMDSRINGNEPLSPRGSRANDIESLWFEALNIYLDMVRLLDVKEDTSRIESTVGKVKNNFTKLFYDETKGYLADCERSDGKKDFSMRPNQLFCVNAGYGLLSKESRHTITVNSFRNLCFPHGVVSLGPDEKDFHPYHDGCKMYHKDAAYHNGAIWLWLSGPMVSALCNEDLQETAWLLTKNHCQQILEIGCAGCLSENADAALTKENEITPSGTWSQAWSMGEFVRNFYQDYLGLRPALLKGQILFNPRIPSSWGEGYACIYLGKGMIMVSWSKEKNGSRDYSFCIKKEIGMQCSLIYKPDSEETLEKKVTLDSEIQIHIKTQRSNQKLDFAKLKPLDEYQCLKEKDYLFNKIIKAWKGLKIYGVN